MTFSTTVPSGPRINTTPQVDTHPADHITIHAALSDIVNILGPAPDGDAANLTQNLALLCPVGEVKMYAGVTAPSGWQACNGEPISRTTYAELFAVIGTIYGEGDGSTTFNKPDLRNRFVAGRGTATWSSANSQTGGNKDAVAVAHTHTTADHAHTFSGTTGNGGAHNHNWGSAEFWYVEAGAWTIESAAFYRNAGNGQHMGKAVYQPAGDHNHLFSGGTSGATSGAGNTTNSQTPTAAAGNANLPPYITMHYIIRVT